MRDLQLHEKVSTKFIQITITEVFYLYQIIERKLIFLHFRQVSPASNKVVAESIGQAATNLNMRKILVNAQIKAMVCLIEAATNVTYITILSTFFSARTGFGTYVVMVFLYMIILPYCFLMNTSHNKNRIVEHGWKNVFNNVLGRQQNSLDDSNEAKSSNSKESTSENDNEESNNEKDNGNPESKNKKKDGNGEETNSITSRNAHKLEGREPSTLLDQDQEHTEEFSRTISELTENRVFFTKASGSNEFPKSIVSKLSDIRRSVETLGDDSKGSERLVLKIMENIHDEDKCMEHFRQLVSHVYSSKYGKIHPELCLREDSLPNTVPKH